MEFREIWSTFILPVIQYLVAPIVTGVVIWFMTSKRSLRENKDKMLRQKNENLVALQTVINYIEEARKSLDYQKDLTECLERMNNGDFSMVEVEGGIGSDQACIEFYENLKRSEINIFNTKFKRAKTAFDKFKNTPKDLLPEKIHLDLISLHSEDKIEAYSEEYAKVLNDLNKIK
ncbi:hypothetical protein [Lysinibacillus xylanilyticus]|uniref:hypothetical protein n=1 Tax=Lysinibacillus xylanilyticus TaxID=582475 RepID=UPI0037F452EE